MVVAHADREIQLHVLEVRVAGRVHIEIPGIHERVPAADHDAAFYERNLRRIADCFGLFFGHLGTDMRNDAVVTGQDRVARAHPVGLAGLDVRDVDIFVVRRVPDVDGGTVETDLYVGIFGVQQGVMRARSHQVFHGRAGYRCRYQVTHE